MWVHKINWHLWMMLNLKSFLFFSKSFVKDWIWCFKFPVFLLVLEKTKSDERGKLVVWFLICMIVVCCKWKITYFFLCRSLYIQLSIPQDRFKWKRRQDIETETYTIESVKQVVKSWTVVITSLTTIRCQPKQQKTSALLLSLIHIWRCRRRG